MKAFTNKKKMTKKYKIPKMAVSKIVITFNIIRVFSIKNLKNHKQKGPCFTFSVYLLLSPEK
jgi:hypothetical protein